MASDPQLQYQQRLNRYVIANYNAKPDRIPVRIFSEEFSAKYCGYNNYEVAVNPELQFDINREFAVRTGIDATQANSVVNRFGMQKALGWEGIVFPGIGIPVDLSTSGQSPQAKRALF